MDSPKGEYRWVVEQDRPPVPSLVTLSPSPESRHSSSPWREHEFLCYLFGSLGLLQVKGMAIDSGSGAGPALG